MSASMLQRVVVRMLYDPALVQSIYSDVDQALADVDLTPEERRWLLAADVRAFGTDPYRRPRTLQALLEEYLVSAALAAERVALPQLDAFFSTSTFHHCIQSRGSLSQCFGTYLRVASFWQGDPRGSAIAALEQSIAGVRRGLQRRATLPTPQNDALWVLAPWCDVQQVPGGTLEFFAQSMAVLRRFQEPVAEVLAPGFRLPAGTELDPAASEWILVEPAQDGSPGAGTVTQALGRLLDAARMGQSRDTLSHIAMDLGASAADAAELVQSFIGDAILIPRES